MIEIIFLHLEFHVIYKKKTVISSDYILDSTQCVKLM